MLEGMLLFPRPQLDQPLSALSKAGRPSLSQVVMARAPVLRAYSEHYPQNITMLMKCHQNG